MVTDDGGHLGPAEDFKRFSAGACNKDLVALAENVLFDRCLGIDEPYLKTKWDDAFSEIVTKLKRKHSANSDDIERRLELPPRGSTEFHGR